LSDERIQLLKNWLNSELDSSDYGLEPASSDASFRRYFRINHNNKTLIAMDAPPEQEDSSKFIKTAKMFATIGVNVPLILAENLPQGFLLLSDLGVRQFMDELNKDTVDRMYADAMAALVTIQASGTDVDLPEYDLALLMRELEIFREWYLQKHIAYPINENVNQQIEAAFEFLASSALEQPQVVVHRDFHSRNLMISEQQNPAIIDFQDAVIGPVTYDLVSLLRDCYIEWPQEKIQEWMLAHHENCLQTGIIEDVDAKTFQRWFDLMGVQRHLKAAGIFARLSHRDAKPGYLKDIPRTLSYVQEVASRYSELTIIKTILESIDLPQHKLNPL